jgi:hypothetical protein
MTPEHPRWEEFCERLAASVTLAGCHGCGHPAGHDGARAILTSMNDLDGAASLAYFREHGGHCDCEILLNLAAAIEEG